MFATVRLLVIMVGVMYVCGGSGLQQAESMQSVGNLTTAIVSGICETPIGQIEKTVCQVCGGCTTEDLQSIEFFARINCHLACFYIAVDSNFGIVTH